MDPTEAGNRSNYFLTDFFMDYDMVKAKLEIDYEEDKRKKLKMSQRHWFLKYIDKIKIFADYEIWYYYLSISILVGVTQFLFQYILIKVMDLIKPYKHANLLNFTISNLIFGTISTWICFKWGVEAQGAGLPELKCILSGGKMLQCLQLRIFFVKWTSLFFGRLSNLYIGTIGPFAHMGSVIAYQLLQLRIFKKIKENNVIQTQSIMIGAATGMCVASLGPISSIIFGIEISGKLTTITTIWKMFVTTYFGKLVFDQLQMAFIPKFPILKHKVTHINNNELYEELYIYVALGILCGISSTLFVKLFVRLNQYRTDPKSIEIFKSRFRYSWIIIIVSSYVMYRIDIFRGPLKVLNELFQTPENIKEQISDLLKQSLLFFYISFLLTLTNITVPISSGAIGGLMATGGFIGYSFGLFLNHYGVINLKHLTHMTIAGAAANVSTTTRLLSLCFIILEQLQNFDLSGKVIITTIFSFGTSNLMTKSFLYSTIELRKMPFVNKLMKREVYQKEVKEVMSMDKIYLTMDSNIQDIFDFFSKCPDITLNENIPVVNSQSDNYLIGIVKVSNLLAYFKQELKANENYKDLISKTKTNWLIQMHYFIKIIQMQEPDNKTSGQQLLEITKAELSRVFQIKQDEKKENSDRKNSKLQVIELAQKFDFIQDIGVDMTEAMLQHQGQLQQSKYQFLHQKVDFEDEILSFNHSPLVVTPHTQLCKIHFLFISLQVQKIYVVELGVLKGIITKQDFLRLNNK